MNREAPRYDHHPLMFRAHPIGFIALIVMIVGPVLALMVCHDTLTQEQFGGMPPLILLVLSAMGLLSMMYWLAMARSTRLRITGNELHFEEGLLHKHHVDLHTNQIRAVKVAQGPINRWLQIGRIAVYTTGDRPELVAYGMPYPHFVRDYIRAQQRAAGS